MAKQHLKAPEDYLQKHVDRRPSWESHNEGIHERVNFDDTIWGFDLAGGAYYNTPLRVTAVRENSRAQKAGIRPGDLLLRINDVDTSSLTIQEAHDMILKSGIHIQLAVSAPEDTDTTYSYWQDPIESECDSKEDGRTKDDQQNKPKMFCKTNSNWGLQWPWVSKRRIIYKESNCYLVPSAYENKHRDRFSAKFMNADDIILQPKSSVMA